jgi:hypothetical protein
MATFLQQLGGGSPHQHSPLILSNELGRRSVGNWHFK